MGLEFCSVDRIAETTLKIKIAFRVFPPHSRLITSLLLRLQINTSRLDYQFVDVSSDSGNPGNTCLNSEPVFRDPLDCVRGGARAWARVSRRGANEGGSVTVFAVGRGGPGVRVHSRPPEAVEGAGRGGVRPVLPTASLGRTGRGSANRQLVSSRERLSR